MSDDRFEEFVRREARDYHQPPETPREPMWERIVAERKEGQGHRGQGMYWTRWGLAAAAVLALGIAIGRFSAVRTPAAPPFAVGEIGEPGAGIGSAYDVAAAQHLRRVETFLTVFRTEAGARPVEGAPASARALLSGTRLLLDSPAGEDPRVAALLKDIELILVQIASFTGDDGSDELDFIQQGMERRGVLLKLRSVVPEGLSVATAQGVL